MRAFSLPAVAVAKAPRYVGIEVAYSVGREFITRLGALGPFVANSGGLDEDASSRGLAVMTDGAITHRSLLDREIRKIGRIAPAGLVRNRGGLLRPST